MQIIVQSLPRMTELPDPLTICLLAGTLAIIYQESSVVGIMHTFME